MFRRRPKPNYTEISRLERETGLDDGVADDQYLTQEIEEALDSVRVKGVRNPNWRENGGVVDLTDRPTRYEYRHADWQETMFNNFASAGSSMSAVLPRHWGGLLGASINFEPVHDPQPGGPPPNL